MTINKTNSKKTLGVFSLVMINVIAVDSLRSLPIGAEYGLSAVFFYLLAAVIFFIPTALVAAELATGWPTTGGIYVWVREACGPKLGLITIWIQWIYNIVWYPTILSFVAATIAYIFKPELADHKLYLLISVLTIFWLSTLVNCFGIKISSLVSTLGAIFGTILPMIFIIILGATWLMLGKPTTLTVNWHNMIPKIHSVNNLVYFAGILFGLIGMEMSAIHAGDVKQPQRDYPRALFYSTLIIISTLLFASIAIAIVIPPQKISLVSGLINTFSIFFTAFHMTWMIPVIALLIVLGSFAGVSAWIIGPTKGLLIAIKDLPISTPFSKVNKYHMPVNILILQGVIFTVLCSVFILLPSVNSSFWLLSAMTAQLAMMGYILMFCSCLILRYKQPQIKRSFTIPGGKLGLWIVTILGLSTCIGTIIIGFFPPSGLNIGSTWLYELILCGGIIIFCVIPLFILTVLRPGRLTY